MQRFWKHMNSVKDASKKIINISEQEALDDSLFYCIIWTF